MTGEGQRNVVLGTVIFLVGLILGVWPTLTYQRSQAADRLATETAEQQERLERVEEELAFAELHAELGLVMLQAHRQNFGIAQRQGAELFQRLGEFARTTEDASRGELARGLAARQGEILGDLATSSPAAAEKLGDVYLEWQQELGGG